LDESCCGILMGNDAFHRTANLSSDVLDRFLVCVWQVIVFWGYSKLQDSGD
jgi:hypothetical protein